MALVACGSTSPIVPSPVDAGHTVTAVVFYDENGNGVLDASEGARVPDVDVEVGGHIGRSEKVTGRVVIQGVPTGSYPLSIRGIPAFYRLSGVLPIVQVPQTSDILIPLTLSIKSNRPNTYMGFGDSITDGDGSTDDEGYRSILQAKLLAHFGRGVIINEAESGTQSDRGAERIGDSLRRVKPAYTLILYGTNDWNDSQCMDTIPCFTLDSLRFIVRSVRAAGSLPFLATIIPANPARPHQVPPDRNEWVRQENDFIRPMAQQEGAVLVDLYTVFIQQGDITQLFVDHVHPNDRGYQLMADAFFSAISQPSPIAASGMVAGRASPRHFGFSTRQRRGLLK